MAELYLTSSGPFSRREAKQRRALESVMFLQMLGWPLASSARALAAIAFIAAFVSGSSDSLPLRLAPDEDPCGCCWCERWPFPAGCTAAASPP
ncbi:unnamed protein product [Spirodela intermedia]|uniref:Uncharacterized protein n=2 Tax=Spirodela intermedia TaxID=51605 RepID=A0A7I8IDW6_SPIIN|nr:unnamed protein product [Spirodela intermedia]CAA6655966.1 unnamed protein product [Spirodela intermedia]CAA7391380.1 unnamed protein product [Spirodela intermedia]